ncbi:hypothetical protein Ais01nite_68200 [Asanoa ishikariensis]|uniref:Leucine rich repeat variant n=1 Tax=Asanoa ishikariensis TaxID=137265 RepID=A0A1H3N8G3_9ACTN|nr:hypothetical protein [Asanoa ishikariensis]GIF68785.1 hypothetical protein Ais01nite_68200 [Asanoa ishikariensis]SDY85231.1 hypothetical protein SAMN05421684_1910 [Asanoa ishikariensis]
MDVVWVLGGLAANPALTPAALDRLVAVGGWAVDDELAARADLTDRHVEQLARHGSISALVTLVRRRRVPLAAVEHRPWAIVALLDDHDIPEAWLWRVAAERDSELRAELALAAACPPDLLRLLAQDPDLVSSVAASAALTPALAEEFARHPDVVVRRAVAANRDAPASVLADLAADIGDRTEAAYELQLAVAGNPAAPVAPVTALVGHPSRLVRLALAERSDLDPDSYRALARDVEVRRELAANPAVGEPLIRELATNDLRRWISRNPALPLDVLADLAAGIRIGPAPLPRIASATQVEIRRFAAGPLRALLAQHPDLPADVAATMPDDPDPRVARAVASNPLVTADQLRRMTARHGGAVAAGVVRNPNCPRDLLDDLLGTEAGRRLLRAVAAHPNAAPATVAALLDHDDHLVASSAAANPALPAEAAERILAVVSECDQAGKSGSSICS